MSKEKKFRMKSVPKEPQRAIKHLYFEPSIEPTSIANIMKCAARINPGANVDNVYVDHSYDGAEFYTIVPESDDVYNKKMQDYADKLEAYNKWAAENEANIKKRYEELEAEEKRKHLKQLKDYDKTLKRIEAEKAKLLKKVKE